MKFLNLPLLSIRRKRQKLSLCYRIVTGRSIIPPSRFTPHPCPSLRHAHHMPLYYPRFRTTSHQLSFYVSVIPIWNTLHRTILSSPSSSSFKSRLSLARLSLVLHCVSIVLFISLYFVLAYNNYIYTFLTYCIVLSVYFCLGDLYISLWLVGLPLCTFMRTLKLG